MKKLALFLTLVILVGACIGCFSAVAEEASEPVKLVYYYKAVSDATEQSDPEMLKAVHDVIMEETGVDLEIIIGPRNDEDYTTKLNLLLSSNQQVDIFTDSWSPLYVKGFLADLTDYIPKVPEAQEALAMMRQETIDSVTVNGRMMAMPFNDAGACYPVWLRSDLLEKCGLEAPQTIEELEAVLRAFKEQDPVGNGNTMGLVTSAEGLRKAFMGGFTANGDGRFMDEDGNIKPYFLDPGYKDFVQTMHDWYSEGLIEPETFSYNRNNIIEFIRQGRVASFAEWYSMVTLSYKQFKDAFPEAEWTWIDGLTGEKGLAESIWPVSKPSVGERSGDAVCINKNCKDIEAALRVVSWGYLNNGRNFLTAYQGIEGVNWRWVDEETRTYELIPSEQNYMGEYNMYMSLTNELSVNSLDPERLFHNAWLREGWFRYDKVKWSVDKDVQYDNAALKENVPSYVEIMEYVEQEFVKFVIGARSMEEWDAYSATVEQLGVDAMVAEFTRQYNEQMKG